MEQVINATYNPTTGALSGGATIPIGAAENGYRIGVEGDSHRVLCSLTKINSTAWLWRKKLVGEIQ